MYIYLTPLEDTSGSWDEFWTPSPSGCSRRCGGGVLAETRDVRAVGPGGFDPEIQSNIPPPQQETIALRFC